MPIALVLGFGLFTCRNRGVNAASGNPDDASQSAADEWRDDRKPSKPLFGALMFAARNSHWARSWQSPLHLARAQPSVFHSIPPSTALCSIIRNSTQLRLLPSCALRPALRLYSTRPPFPEHRLHILAPLSSAALTSLLRRAHFAPGTHHNTPPHPSSTDSP